MAAYEMAPGRSTSMRDAPMRWKPQQLYHRPLGRTGRRGKKSKYRGCPLGGVAKGKVSLEGLEGILWG